VAGPWVHGTSLNMNRPSEDLRLGYKKTKSYFCSNLDRRRSAFATPRRRSSSLRHGGRTSMRLGPTASQRQAMTVCAHLGLR
jgi:hypothetical protein